MWEITNRGFLPTHDPLQQLTSDKYPNQANRLDRITKYLPYWIDDRRVREELVCELKSVPQLITGEFIRSLDERNIERLMHLFSYFASAYVYAKHETPAVRIPCVIAYPLLDAAVKLNRKPILSYASYCLTNWKRKDENCPISLGNIKLLTNFCSPNAGGTDEDWFILVHVEIEAQAALGISACNTLLKDVRWDYLDILNNILFSLLQMNHVLARMPEQCRPENYFRLVRPYIFSFNDILYEDAGLTPKTFRGETGAQSSIIPAFLAALEIKHKDSMLTHHLKEMRDYMPAPHREFLHQLENREHQEVRAWATQHPEIKDIYNQCVEQIIKFRDKHFEYAIEYIESKVDNPAGTGGTPYVPWLKQLRDETEEFLIP